MDRSLASLAFGLGLLLPLMASAATTESAAAPHAVVAEPVKDFGVLTTGEKVTHEFVLRNEGGAPLEIRSVQPSCGCTLASFERLIPPGGAGKVIAEVDALKLNGKSSGRLRVETNDPAQPTLDLELRYEVKPSIGAKPGYARWTPYVQGEPVGTIGQLLWALDGEAFEVVSLEVPPSLRGEFRPARPEERKDDVTGSQWKVDITLPADAPVGPVTGLVVVHTTHPKQRRVPLAVSGMVKPRYFLEPSSANFGKFELSEPATIVYRLRNFATAPVEVEGLETTVQGITATVTPTEAGRRFAITLRLDPQAMALGAFDGKLLVRLSDPQQATLEMPLKGELLPAAPSTPLAPGR